MTIADSHREYERLLWAHGGIVYKVRAATAMTPLTAMTWYRKLPAALARFSLLLRESFILDMDVPRGLEHRHIEMRVSTQISFDGSTVVPRFVFLSGSVMLAPILLKL